MKQNKGVIGIGLVLAIVLGIVVVGIIIYFGYNYFVNPRVISVESTNVSYCSDSDGNNINSKGIVRFSRMDNNAGEGESSIEDVCDYYSNKTDQNVGLVREGVCNGNKLDNVLMTCGMGNVCRSGACVKKGANVSICSDSDGGKNIKEKGNIVGYGGSGEDSCWVSADGSLTNGSMGESCDADSVKNGRCYVGEYYCDGDNKTEEMIPCPNGCSKGVCL